MSQNCETDQLQPPLAPIVSTQQSFGGHSTDGRIQQLNHMKCGHGLQAAPCEAHSSTAAGTRDWPKPRPARSSTAGYPPCALPSWLAVSGCSRLNNARRTAAQRCFRNFSHFEFGDSGQQMPRLLAHTLRMLQMARIVIGDAQLERMALRLRLQLAQESRRYLCISPRKPPPARPIPDRRAADIRTPSSSIRSRRS